MSSLCWEYLRKEKATAIRYSVWNVPDITGNPIPMSEEGNLYSLIKQSAMWLTDSEMSRHCSDVKIDSANKKQNHSEAVQVSKLHLSIEERGRPSIFCSAYSFLPMWAIRTRSWVVMARRSHNLKSSMALRTSSSQTALIWIAAVAPVPVSNRRTLKRKQQARACWSTVFTKQTRTAKHASEQM